MKKILILSEDIHGSLLFNKVFEVAGYETLVITTIQDARSSLQESQIDLITMILPLITAEEKMKGWEFYSELKNNQNFCKIPVIVYTIIHRDHLPDPRDYGDVLLTMPLAVSVLRDKVGELLGPD